VQCHLAPITRELGMVKRRVISNGSDRTTRVRNRRTKARDVSSRWCERPSVSSHPTTDRSEAAFAACDVSSRRGLVALNHCHVATVQCDVVSITGESRIDAGDVGAARRDLSPAKRKLCTVKCDVMSNRHDLNADHSDLRAQAIHESRNWSKPSCVPRAE
jgi:hypothetical protein